MKVDDLKNQARNKWSGIFTQLGIDVGTGEHRPCPNCGGTDRFRFTDLDGDGMCFCNQCGAGDGLHWVMLIRGVDLNEAINLVAEVVGCCEEKPVENKPNPAIALNKLWKSSCVLTGDDPVSKYLRGRGLMFHPECLRFCPNCYEKETGTEIPAMLARVQSKDGKPITIHRTYLSADGKKADIGSPKKLMPGTQHLAGSAIRLFPPQDGWIGVAEGIETAISCKQLFDAPCWAVTGTSLMEVFIPPDGVRRISIYADKDANMAGEKAAYVLANKLYLQDYIVEVLAPDEIGDFNDEIMRMK